MSVEERPRIQQHHPEFGYLAGDGTEDCLGVATLQGQQDFGGLEVGVEALEQPARRDLARHDGVAGFKLRERLEHLAELTHEEDAALGFGE